VSHLALFAMFLVFSKEQQTASLYRADEDICFLMDDYI